MVNKNLVSKWVNPCEFELRWMEEAESPLFAEWEKCERPYPWTPQHFIETMGSSCQRTLVWERNKLILGFAVIQWIDDEMYLLNFMISPTLRGQGHGMELLIKCLSWGKKGSAKYLDLDVDANNVAAIRLYKNAGFEIVAKRKHSYPYGEDAIQMRKYL